MNITATTKSFSKYLLLQCSTASKCMVLFTNEIVTCTHADVYII